MIFIQEWLKEGDFHRVDGVLCVIYVVMVIAIPEIENYAWRGDISGENYDSI